jgi:beta-galactosidase
MIERDRNRPSIILWGVRINESVDDPVFYRSTNDLARSMDPPRPTGGVRDFLSSEFLEDVFTFNDFTDGIAEPVHTPHLVSECNGHMFPTKPFDNEERLVEHALRHARVHDLGRGNPRVSGVLGWCAFDYVTHREFGSGDRICHHGVMDPYRSPKYAAWFYESQQSPDRRRVLRIATGWSMGDRSGGGNDPLYIFTNCDSVEVYVGETLHGRFMPARERFPHLAYPPVVVEGLTMARIWGDQYEDLRVCGYIGGEPVMEHRIEAGGLPSGLLLRSDDAVLHADGADCTRLVFGLVDKYGNPLRYSRAVVSVSLEGDASLVGENPYPLLGGLGALYVRAGCSPSGVRITARAREFAAQITLRTESKGGNP